MLTPPPMRWRDEPPRAVTIALFVALAALLVYPLHRPYLNPDQDVPPTLPLTQMAWGTWSPLILMYGSALPNLLHLLDVLLLELGRLLGWWREPADLLVAWCQAPWLFRIPPRAIAMAAGFGSLLAARGITAAASDRATALTAPALLGSWLLFVREHHHGWYDAPASGAAMLAVWAATSHVREPRLGRLALAGALAGLATSFKLNLAATVPAVLVAAIVGSPQRRLRAAAVAVAGTIVGFVVTTPESVLETARMWDYVATYIPIQAAVLANAAGAGGNRLGDAMVRGIGGPGLVVAAAGIVAAGLARERVLLPTLAFLAAYGVILLRAPLVLNRYALPIAGPLAVLAAYGLARLPSVARVAAVAVLVAFGLPSCLQYVRLLGREDTRTEAARLVEAEWARGGRVVVAANPVLATYAGPDLPQLPRYDRGLPPPVEQALSARAPRCMRPLDTILPATAEALAAEAGSLVLTSDPPASIFARATSPPAVVALLARHARLIADLAVERAPADRTYELFDLNFVPFDGLGSLVRPGPRLRLWRVPEHARGAPDER